MESSDLKIVQDYLLEMVLDITELCHQANIPLFAVGGTLLGAVRYKGFIPWDDDLDFALRRSDLVKLSKLIEDSDKYDLHIPKIDSTGNYVRFPKFYEKILFLNRPMMRLLLTNVFLLIFLPLKMFRIMVF